MKDLFAPPTQEELNSLYSAPTQEELQSLKQQPLEESQEPSKTESFARGAAQGLSLGFADELTGALGAVSDVAGDKYQLADLLERYKAQRDESRLAYRRAEEANPLTSMAGNITGGAATALIPGLGGATLANALKIGAVTGLGAAEGDTLGEQAKSAALGAGIGAAGYGAGKLVGAASDALKTSEAGRMLGLGLKVGEEQGYNLSKPAASIGMSGEKLMPKGLEEAKEALKKSAGEILQPIDEFGAVNAAAKRKIIDEAENAAGKSPIEFVNDAKSLIENSYNILGVDPNLDVDYQKLAALVKSVKSPQIVSSDELGNLITKPGDIKANARMYDELRKQARDIVDNAQSNRGREVANEIYKLARDYTRQSVDQISKARLPKIDEAIEAAIEIDKILGLAQVGKIGTSVRDQSKIAGLFDKLESVSSSGLTAQLKKDAMIEILEKVNPDLAKKVSEKISKSADLSTAVKAAEVKGINLDLINKSAPIKLGTAIGSNKMYQDIKRLATKTPDYYNKVADSLIGKEKNQALVNVFRKMATADNNTRNALLFGIYQNPAFRETMNELASSED